MEHVFVYMSQYKANLNVPKSHVHVFRYCMIAASHGRMVVHGNQKVSYKQYQPVMNHQ